MSARAWRMVRTNMRRLDGSPVYVREWDPVTEETLRRECVRELGRLATLRELEKTVGPLPGPVGFRTAAICRFLMGHNEPELLARFAALVDEVPAYLHRPSKS